MKRRTFIYSPWMAKLAMAVGMVVFVAGCNQENLVEPNLTGSSQLDAKKEKTKTFYGPASPMGQGVARLWVRVNAAGNPIAMGVNMLEKAVLNLGEEHREWHLRMPQQVAVPPFDHVMLEYNPHGHEPEGIYDLPHFDLHFYMLPERERMMIPGMMPPYMDPAPEAKYIPAAYVQGPGLVPAMGAHWVDVLSAEFQPRGKFTHTFILGTYNRQIIFWEPMFTVEYLKSHPNEEISIRQPRAFQKSGYYATSYGFSYSRTPKEFTISLNNLTYRQAE